MDIKLILIFTLFLVFGIIVMATHKFYKYNISDMLFATKLRVFLAGFLSSLVGIYGLVKAVLEIIKAP